MTQDKALFKTKSINIFLISAEKVCCGYSLEVPHCFTCLIYTGCIGRYGRPLLKLTSLNVMTSLNITILSSQYGRRLQSKYLHYQKTHLKKWKVCKKKNLSWVLGTDRKICPSGSQSDTTRQALWCLTVTLGTDFAINPSHPWYILIICILHFIWSYGHRWWCYFLQSSIIHSNEVPDQRVWIHRLISSLPDQVLYCTRIESIQSKHYFSNKGRPWCDRVHALVVSGQANPLKVHQWTGVITYLVIQLLV